MFHSPASENRWLEKTKSRKAKPQFGPNSQVSAFDHIEQHLVDETFIETRLENELREEKSLIISLEAAVHENSAGETENFSAAEKKTRQSEREIFWPRKEINYWIAIPKRELSF